MPTIERLKEIEANGSTESFSTKQRAEIWDAIIRVLEAAKELQVFLDTEIGLDKVELTMLRGALRELEGK
jgi:hypothetical protein